MSHRMTFDQLRQELPITRNVAYFQTGSHGPVPDSVLGVVQDMMAFESLHGLASPDTRNVLGEKEQEAREQLARFLSVKQHELAMTYNTTQALLRVFRSISWQRGDQLVVSSREHMSTMSFCQVLEERYGVIAKTIPADEGDDALLESLGSVLSNRTKLVCLSHVTSPDGCRLPVAEASAIAREKGVPLLVDGAQSVGVFPIDVSALGCDYYAASGHKWLLGPTGTSFLWVASEHIPSFRPDFIPDHNPWLLSHEPRPPITVSTRVEMGTRNHALVIGLGRAVEMMEQLGVRNIEAHVGRLSKILRDEVAQWKGVKVLTPTEAGRSAGITSLAFDGYSYLALQGLVAKLYEDQRIVVKFQWLTTPSDPEQIAMRISIAPFNNEEEVHLLVDALKSALAR